MLKWTTIRDLFLIVVALLFLPHESRVILFDTRPEDWYGEARIVVGDEIFILAKNSGTKKISLGFSSVTRNVLRHFDQDSAQDLGDPLSVLPLSYSLVLARADTKFLTDRRVSIDGERIFSPGPLGIATRADYHVGFALIVVLIICFSLLAFGIASYLNERDVQSSGTGSK